MPARGAPGRLRITPRSAVLAVAMFGLTLVLLRVVVAAQRVLGWVLVAAAIAGLLHRLVARVARRLPRGLAVLAVVGGSAATVGVVGYGLVDALVTETARLQQAAPAAARRIERSGRFAEVARDARLAERTERFLEELPEQLRGGTPAEAVRAATTRAVAYLATGVLSIFFLLHGGRLAAGAARQLPAGPAREGIERVALVTFRRGFGYARGSIAMSAGAGLVAYAVGRAAHVPGPVPLALWVALWDLVPIIGFAIGALPIVVLAGVGHTERGVAIAGVFLGYQLVEALVLQRRLERTTIRLGPFLTTAGGLAGLELYGIGGALVTVLLLALAVAALEELAPAEEEAADPVPRGGAPS
ncbi:MAG: AI-2E family transporter [Actinomycetota bacterium]|nr:AI-2E family transporter [Actinomycetota bacterium]